MTTKTIPSPTTMDKSSLQKYLPIGSVKNVIIDSAQERSALRKTPQYRVYVDIEKETKEIVRVYGFIEETGEQDYAFGEQVKMQITKYTDKDWVCGIPAPTKATPQERDEASVKGYNSAGELADALKPLTEVAKLTGDLDAKKRTPLGFSLQRDTKLWELLRGKELKNKYADNDIELARGLWLEDLFNTLICRLDMGGDPEMPF